MKGPSSKQREHYKGNQRKGNQGGAPEAKALELPLGRAVAKYPSPGYGVRAALPRPSSRPDQEASRRRPKGGIRLK